MKIEKLLIAHSEPEDLKEIKSKINNLIDLMSCPTCGNIKGMVGAGLCFPCDEEEEEKHHRK